MYSNRIWNEDCRSGLSRIEDGSVDLVVMDPPYSLDNEGGGAFGPGGRSYRSEIGTMSEGIDDALLDAVMSKMRAVNVYAWCNKSQLLQYLTYFDRRGCNVDLLSWHKTNPTPACGNKYLSDTEYLVFARDPGVKLYGSYETKRKFWVTPANVKDKKAYGHPTVKPLDIIETLVMNSSREGDVVLDPFMGSGTTAAACIRTGRRYLGFEIREDYYDVAMARIRSETSRADILSPMWTGDAVNIS